MPSQPSLNKQINKDFLLHKLRYYNINKKIINYSTSVLSADINRVDRQEH